MPGSEHLGVTAPPRSVLVLHDLTPQAMHAAWRAAMIARDLGAGLVLLHAASKPQALEEGRRVLHALAGDVEDHCGLRPDVRVVQGDAAQAVARSGAGLVVLAARRPNVLGEWLFGTPAERLIRLCGRPVLVVRRPARTPYERVLVPVDLNPSAGTSALAAASRVAAASRIEVFHTLSVRDDVTLRAADVPEAVMRAYRRRHADRVRTKIRELVRTVPGTVRSAHASVAFGDAACMVLAKEQAMRADLVVIGKRRRGLLADFFLGSVTQRVLAAGRSDVLVFTAARREVPGPVVLDMLGRA